MLDNLDRMREGLAVEDDCRQTQESLSMVVYSCCQIVPRVSGFCRCTPPGRLIDGIASTRKALQSMPPMVSACHLWCRPVRMPLPCNRHPHRALGVLTRGVSKSAASSSRWSKSPARLIYELRRIAPQLRMQGLSVTFERNRESRLLTLTQTSRQ